MPKKIDHKAYKTQLAKKAARLFSAHGYDGLGMRKIAAELGLSKSALYHYFPTKRDLFHACTEEVTQFDGVVDSTLQQAISSAPLTERVRMLFESLKEMEPIFPAEMSLLFEYLRGRAPNDIAKDPSMRLANDRYYAMVEQFVGKQHALPVMAIVTGALMHRYFNGQTTDLEEYQRWLVVAIESLESSDPS